MYGIDDKPTRIVVVKSSFIIKQLLNCSVYRGKNLAFCLSTQYPVFPLDLVRAFGKKLKIAKFALYL